MCMRHSTLSVSCIVSVFEFQTFDHAHATMESAGDSVSKPQVKKVEDHHASKESTKLPDARPHVKTVGDKHITQQSKGEPESRPHIRSFKDMHANKRSSAPEHDNVPKLKLGVMHSSTETKAFEWKVKKQNVFGHVSQLSNSYDVVVPKLKKSELMSAVKESDWSKDYCIKPKIRINKEKMANVESEATLSGRRTIKMSDKMSATKESEYVDMEARRVQMFKERNVHGHAADSTVEKLLYVGKYNDKKVVKPKGM